MTDCDLVVIGSGPAGIATATTAASYDLKVTLLDEQSAAGGQIYRALEACSDDMAEVLGEDYIYGKKLLDQLTHSNVIRINNATVWAIDNAGCITYSRQQTAHQIHAKHIVIATGALERSTPLPGWTLPGVMTVGAAQILLKNNQISIKNAVLAGTGPLLYTVANQLIKARCKPKAIIDTISTSHYLRAAAAFPAASLSTISKGLSYLRNIKKAGIPFYKGITDLSITGTSCVEAIQFHHKGKINTLETDNVLLHQGVVPNTQLSRSLRLDHTWNTAQHCFQPDVDQWGATSAPNVSIAGDGSGIGGALVAEMQGNVTALNVLATLDIISNSKRDSLAAPINRQLKSHARLRKFLDILYEPPAQVLLPDDGTMVCRCEEVTAGDIRSYAKIGCSGPNQTKAFGRCGMGPCQGRYCGLTVTQILARENGLSHDEVGAYRIRSPIKPVTLAELASLDNNT